MKLRDLIYFDIAKAESILSQLEGGLILGTEASSDRAKETHNIRKYLLKIFEGEFGGIETQTESTIERRRRHHEMANLLEEFLLEEGYAVDINANFNISQIKNGSAHEKLLNLGFVKVTGWVNLEDYTYLQFILNRFNMITDFITNSQKKNSPELVVLEARIAEKETIIRNLPSSQKGVAKKEIAQIKKQIKDTLDSFSNQNKLEDWLVKGLDDFIQTFLKDRLNLFVFPFDDYLSFHTISSLKRECFIDTDIARFIDSYGAKPNIKLTVMGLITSIPLPNSPIPDLSEKYALTNEDGSIETAMAVAFSGLFSRLEDLGKHFTFSYYPNLTVYPITIYREIIRQRDLN